MVDVKNRLDFGSQFFESFNFLAGIDRCCGSVGTLALPTRLQSIGYHPLDSGQKCGPIIAAAIATCTVPRYLVCMRKY